MTTATETQTEVEHAPGADMYRCINTSNRVRTFTSYDEAYRFVMREGDCSRLWSLERVS